MASLFRPATVLMVQYAHYHRDRRNIATHYVGIPLIVFGIGVLLARWQLDGNPLTAAWLLWILSTLWYLSRGNLLLGVAVSMANGLLIALAHQVAGGSVAHWLGWGLGSFAVGWVLQFIGHYFEGRKPAFMDDLVGLLVGPMFVTGEALFALGWGKNLLAEIERSAGPTCIRPTKKPQAF
ncbi:Mpo1-like protein [Rhodoferax sp.]|uniref:Mpo1 family 2-hydroxy fatty acid dioxygenase n=1 Tax=Rhodoferax sp. TaxID=50421 RepID=UPI0025CFAD85|nr:Mpo1-like protein [Rhodoferax sp.]